VTGATVTTTDHGTAFASVVDDGPVMGVQFHPEKSGAAGLQILRNFVRLAERC
jgi:glutamine amidotransferase